MTYAPADLNTIEHFVDVDGGLLYTGLVPGRDRDVLGRFARYWHFSPDLRRSQAARGEPGMDHEAVLELNYEYNVTPWLYLQPDIQGILRPRVRVSAHSPPPSLTEPLDIGIGASDPGIVGLRSHDRPPWIRASRRIWGSSTLVAAMIAERGRPTHRGRELR